MPVKRKPRVRKGLVTRLIEKYKTDDDMFAKRKKKDNTRRKVPTNYSQKKPYMNPHWSKKQRKMVKDILEN